MSTTYTLERPLPWCALCQRHHVQNAGQLCPICADMATPTAAAQAATVTR